MKKLRLFAVLSAIIMCMTLFMPTSYVKVFADDSNPSVEEPEGNPEFVFKGQQYFTVKAGKVTTISVKVDNVSRYSSKMTTANIKDESSVFKFNSQTSFTERSIPNNVGRTFTFDLEVPDTLKAGRYTLTLDLTNVNYDMVPSKQSLPFYIDVENDFDASGVTVSDYSIDKTDIKSGDSFNISAVIKNNSGADIKDIKVELEGLDGTKFAMASGLSYTSLSLKNGEEKTLVFPVIACSGISSIREVIPLTVSYFVNPENKDTKQENTANITVACKKTTSSDGKGFAPNLIIESYSFGGDYVVAGKTFPLNLKIKNTSSTAKIENLKVTVQGVAANSEKGGIAFSPANSSNSFFFQNLNASASTEINIDILTKADATPDSYPIEVVFDYEYIVDGKKDKADTVTEKITIPIQQDDRFTSNEVEIMSDCSVGEECPLNVSFINKGKSAIYNVSVDVEGEGFDKTSSAYYIGNIESGNEENYDTTIIPNTEGQIVGNVVITYEDSNGNEKKLKKEFMTNAMQMYYDDPMINGEKPIDDMPVDVAPQGGMPVWLIIVIIVGGILLVGGVVTVIIIKNKKKKALIAETEDDDENI